MPLFVGALMLLCCDDCLLTRVKIMRFHLPLKSEGKREEGRIHPSPSVPTSCTQYKKVLSYARLLREGENSSH